MQNTKTTYAFITGEIDPKMWGRSNVSQYGMGLAEATNFFVDYRGGISKRPGSKVISATHNINNKLCKFKAEGSDFLLEFVPRGIKFIRNGSYLASIRGGVTILVERSGNTRFFSIQEDNIRNGTISLEKEDYIYLINSIQFPKLNYNLIELGENRKLLNITPSLDAVSSNNDGSFLVKIHTVKTPYTSTDLPFLSFTQNNLDLYITNSKDLSVYKLTYKSDSEWLFEPFKIEPSISATSALHSIPSASGDASYVVAVTGVNNKGEEGAVSEYVLQTNSVNFTVPKTNSTAGHSFYLWSKLPNIHHYNVYRSVVFPSGQKIQRVQELGYIGRAFDNSFIDNNIIPDFTKSPPSHDNPFAGRRVEYINIIKGGSNYLSTSKVVAADGQGFHGYPSVNASGEITSVNILSKGSGYNTNSITFTEGNGAEVEVILSPSSGNFPSISTIFQQRLIFGASSNYPGTIWGSRINKFNNFDTNQIQTASDSFELTLNQFSADKIKHFLPFRTGLYIFTSSGVYKLFGEQNKFVSGVSAIVSLQNFRGVSSIVPLIIDQTILFTQDISSSLYSMIYSEYSDSFKEENLSLFVSHLINTSNKIISLDYMEIPHKLLYCIKEDGTRLICTHAPELAITGWSQDKTDGEYISSIVLKERGKEVLYQYVKRTLQEDTPLIYLEKVEFNTEEPLYLDCAITKTYRTAKSIISGLWLFEGNSMSVWDNEEDLGKYLVTNGEIDLGDRTVTNVQVGLPYTAKAVTLPPVTTDNIIFEGRRKTIMSASIRIEKTKGLEIGAIGEESEELKYELPDKWDDEINPLSGMVHYNVTDNWRQDTQMVFKHSTPFPCNILGITLNYDLGDD